MNVRRRDVLHLAGCTVALSAVSRIARAQTYPTRPIHVIVPFTPGSPVDAAARVLTQQVQLRIGQGVVIENRPGGGTTIGTKAAASAPPDGYTLLFVGDALGYFPVLYPNFDFDPLKDLTPITTAVTWSHLMVVAPSVPARTVGELVAYAKANPGKLVFGFGLGTAPQILGEAFRNATGVDINFVPYRGGEQARADLLGGRVDINFAPVANLLPLIQDGKARPLAFTGPRRTPHLPEVPTMAESGYPQVGFNPDVWLGFFGPAGMPRTIVDRLNTEINQSVKSPEVNAVLEKLGFEPKVSTPEEFAAFLASEMQKWPPLLRAAGLKPV
jgi:tripartite-type tricarboxylate transporter receptor subunit TctC